MHFGQIFEAAIGSSFGIRPVCVQALSMVADLTTGNGCKMAEKSSRFTKYFPMLLDALRSADPNPIRPAEAMARIRSKGEVPAEALTRFVQNGAQSEFANDVHWARFYLVKAGLLDNAKRGLWRLTPEGREAKLSPEATWNLYIRTRDANRLGDPATEEDAPAPGAVGDSEEDEKSYWFVGAIWNGNNDQLPRFLGQGIWENGYSDQFLDHVLCIRPGD